MVFEAEWGEMSNVEPRNRAERRAAERTLRRTETGRRRRAVGAALTAGSAALATTAVLVGAGSGTMVGAASTITVNSTLDTNVAGTLRNALNIATSGDTIVFDLPAGSVINLGSDLNQIDENLTIQGPGSGGVTINGGDARRIFYVGDGTSTVLNVTISGLTFAHGSAGQGGAIIDRGEALTLVDDIFKNNQAEGRGGALFVDEPHGAVTIRSSVFGGSKADGNSAGNQGGAIAMYAARTVEISDTTISGNTSDGPGGGLYVTGYCDCEIVGGPFTMRNTTVSGNTTTSGGGGGVMLDDIYGLITIADSTISDTNTASRVGGGLYVEDSFDGFAMTNTKVTGNVANSGGGGVRFRGMNGASTIDGSTISGNQSGGWGGGLYAVSLKDSGLVISNSTVAGNTAVDGGGGLEFYRNTAEVTVRNSTVSGNHAKGGGGIFFEGNDTDVHVIQSTVSGNTATGNTEGRYAKDGGAISFYTQNNHALEITQSTITNNTGVAVGGLYMKDVSVGSLGGAGHPATANSADAKEKHERRVSSAGNEAHAAAQTTAPATVSGTILAGNAGLDVGPSGIVTANHSIFHTIAASTTFTDAGANLKGVTNVLLGLLADNGGPTLTHALLPGSPAIDAGPVPVETYPANDSDQRGVGYPRVVAGIVDIGAFEVQPIVVQPAFTG